MTDEQVRNIAKIEVREYFDQYLNDIHPRLMKEHFNSCIHGKMVNRVKWMAYGILVAFAAIVPAVGAELFSALKNVIIP